MITEERAWEIAQEGYGASSRDEVILRECDAAYVAYPKVEKPADPTVPPSAVGGTCLVIDKESGEATDVPLRDPEGAVRIWQEWRAS